MLRNHSVTIKTLKSIIHSVMGPGKPSLNKVATKLGKSPRTLQRNISDLGESFSHIVDETRCDKACTLLRQSKPKINEIATLLGYADAGSFTRAFERWMGVSPQQYRNEHNQA